MQYDSYKDSGEQWLGQIPSHWEMRAIRYILQSQHKVVGKKANEFALLSLTLNGVIKRDMDNPTGKFPTTFDTYQEVNPDDFIFCMFDNEETPRAVGLSRYRGMITGAYDVMQNINALVNNRFLEYYFLDIDNFKKLKPLYKGLRKTVPLDSFKAMKIAIPPLPEQERMVVYLDKETAAIDAAIAQQQRMIDLLNERKQIIIQQAVTKGLDPNAKMKDSGIDWIGQIPEQWEVKPFKSFFTYGRGLNITKSDLTEEGIPVVSYGQIHAKYNKMYCVTQELFRYVPETYLQYQNSLVHKGDFIFADTSEDFEGCGNCVYIDKEQTLFAGYHTIIARPKDRDCDYTYFSFLIMSRAWRTGVRRLVNGVKVFTISRSIISKNKLVVPSIEEQKQISEFLIDETNKIDTEIKSKEQHISLLRERKQIIINEVVTGKIKV